MKRTCVLLLTVVPFAGACLSVAWWDRIHPRIVGVPFNFAWLIAWMPLTSLCLALAHRLQRHSDHSESE